MKIIETDNLGRDYPNEKFLNIPDIFNKKDAEKVAIAINSCYGDYSDRYWRVVKNDYKLEPGFTP